VEAASIRSPAVTRLRRLGPGLSDAQLVARVREGDERAFELVFDRYHPQLLSFCRHMLGGREEAEDALQQVFVSAHGHLVAHDRPVELRPWLYAIARNRCLSVLRGRREALGLDDVPEPSTAGLAVAAEVERREDLRDLLADLARLPDEQRAALLLSELEAFSHDEIADVLGVRREKVKALVFQARESLGGWRQARHTECSEIREQLANLRGGALRRGPLRRHLETCAACRDFRVEVRRQREAMALLLPVLPSLALKAKVVGAVASAHGATHVASGAGGLLGGGITAGAGAPAAALGGGLAAKAAVLVAVAGIAGGGYAVTRHATTTPSAFRTHPSSVPAARHQSAPAPGSTVSRAAGAGRSDTAAHRAGRSSSAPGHTGVLPATANAQAKAHASPGTAHAHGATGHGAKAHGNAVTPAHGAKSPAGGPQARHPKPAHPAKPPHPARANTPAAATNTTTTSSGGSADSGRHLGSPQDLPGLRLPAVVPTRKGVGPAG
jgi:RNA polymerase sigma factor (sigma-70 family)